MKYVAFHHREAYILSPALDFSMLRKTLEIQRFRLKDTLWFFQVHLNTMLSCNRYVENVIGPLVLTEVISYSNFSIRNGVKSHVCAKMHS